MTERLEIHGKRQELTEMMGNDGSLKGKWFGVGPTLCNWEQMEGGDALGSEVLD